MRFLRCIAFIILILFAMQGASQEPSFRNYSTSDGLPSTELYCVLQDQKGFIWFSSDGGLIRFNGFKFATFTVQDGLPDNTIFNLTEDSKGRIWMTGYNGKVGYYFNGKFFLINANENLIKNQKGSNKLVLSLAIDEADNLWLGTPSGMYKIKNKNNYKDIEPYFINNNQSGFYVKEVKPEKVIFSRGELPSNQDNINLIIDLEDDIKNEFIKRYGMDISYSRVLKLSNGDVLFSYKNTLYHFYKNGGSTQQEFSGNIIFLKSYTNQVWIGLKNYGVQMFENNNFTSPKLTYLKNLSVTDICFDHENGLWLTTLEKGLFYSPYNNYFQIKSNGLDEDQISGLGFVGDLLFFVTGKNKMYAMDSLYSIKDFFFTNESNSRSLTRFYKFGEKNIICGAVVGDLSCRNGISKYYAYLKSNIPFSGVALAIIDSGKFYVVINSDLGIIQNGIWKGESRKLPSRATDLFLASDNQIWLGTLEGLYVFKDSVFISINHPILSKVRITSIAEDKKHNLYVSTRGDGLFIYQNKNWINVTDSNGLASNVCNYIYVDSFNTVWIATNKGISFFTRNDFKSIKTIDVNSGLPSNEITSLIRRRQFLYVATRKGLCIVDLQKPYYNTVPSKVYISSISANNKRILSGNYFAYDQNNLTFSINSLCFKKSNKERFVYRLSGWNECYFAGYGTEINFQNLSHGNYTLEVWALNDFGIKSKNPAVYSFIISKPFWITWWFILIEIVLFTALIYLIVKLRISRVKRIEREKSRINKLIAEYQLTALQAQMNPHFIFNAINSIQQYILNNETDFAYNYLTDFSKLIRLVLEYSKHQSITLNKELQLVELYIKLEQRRFKKRFTYSIECCDNVSFDEILVPVMFIQPYVENAIWHGIMNLPRSKEGILKICFKLFSDELHIIIEDNGIGREEAKKYHNNTSHESLGMLIAQKRMESIQILSNKKIKIEVMDLMEKNIVSGTRVKIILTL